MSVAHLFHRKTVRAGLLAGLLALAPQVFAQNVGVHVNASGNVSGPLASNIKESDGLVTVTPGPADTQITFTTVLDSPFTLSSHSSAIVIDTGEVDFASSAELAGLGFVSGFNGDPGGGSLAIVLSNFGSAPGTTSLSSVTYDLAALVSDGAADWTLLVTGVNVPPGENIVDEDADEAFVRVDAPASGVPALSGPGAAALVAMLAAAGVFNARKKARPKVSRPEVPSIERADDVPRLPR